MANLKRYFTSFSLTVSAHAPSLRSRAKPRQALEPAILERPIYVSYLPHDASVNLSVELTFPRRGCYSQDGLRISTRFPFGFLRKAHNVSRRQHVLVLPKVEPTEEFYEILQLLGSKVGSS